MTPTHTTAELEYEIQRISKWTPAMIEEAEKNGDSTSLLRCTEFLTRARLALAPVNPEVVIDTREQKPWGIEGETVTMKTGDYTVNGMEDVFAIERKSLSDMIGCITSSRDRFERELARAGHLKRFWLIIEAPVWDILNHNYRSLVSPSAVLGSLTAWAIRIPSLRVIFAGNRGCAEAIAKKIIEREAEEKEKK